MGQEIRCTAAFGSRSEQGRAYLEGNELTFRGEAGLRLQIPFGQVTEMGAVDGVLQLTWPGGRAEFHLGDHAEKWLSKIRHPKSMVEKLGIKEGMRVAVLGLDNDFLSQVEGRTTDVSPTKPKKESDVILCRFETLDSLGRIPELKVYLKGNGAIWTVYPKGRKDITQAAVMEAGKAAGLVDTKVVGFSETHSALKWVIPVAQR